MATLGTFASGQVLTAAELNAIGTFTSFTPSWTNITPGTGASNTGQYSIVNKIMFLRVKYVLGTGGALTGGPVMTIPASRTLAGSPTILWYNSIGAAFVDSGVASYPAYVAQVSTTTIQPFVINADTTYARTINTPGATLPFTWGVNDYIEMTGWVQLA